MAKLIKIFQNSFQPQDLKHAIEVLRDGGVIAYPTETTYGLGANIYLENAVEKLYRVKGRESRNPISALISSLDELERLCGETSGFAKAVIQKFWPGPLTLVFAAGVGCPQFLKSEAGKVGIRYPDHQISRTLVKGLGAPITSTSANFSGGQPAVCASDIEPALIDQLDLIIDAGESQIQTSSTVVDVSGDRPVLLREGPIAFDAILSVLTKG